MYSAAILRWCISMDKMYRYRGTKKLRCGYTTGTCAAAAAGAAAVWLLQGTALEKIAVLLPSGERLTIPVQAVSCTTDCAVCAVIKDSGDDPDVTNGIMVCASVEKAADGIEIIGGEGIGKVTKPGLDQPVGAWAINSVPRHMIAAAIQETAEQSSYTGGFRVRLSVPDGETLAARTYNPRMGIIGGISIIGTSGIVEPMSNAALVDTIRTEAAMRRAAGESRLLLTLGNYSEQFLRLHLPLSAEQSVQCSNFIGDALDIGVSLGFTDILLVGHVGKLVKLGAGIMNTHSAQADGRMETLVTCGVLAGADPVILRQLPDCVTVDAALAILEEAGCLEMTMSVLTERIACHMQHRVKGAVRTAAVLFSFQYDKVWTAGTLQESLWWDSITQQTPHTEGGLHP